MGWNLFLIGFSLHAMKKEWMEGGGMFEAGHLRVLPFYSIGLHCFWVFHFVRILKFYLD